ncbi:MAG TPA: DUF1858 domain-containing protein [Spirochaetales bacterium]|nr:DUF1858 domain-containing protein [Spirochaetales bacterium]
MVEPLIINPQTKVGELLNAYPHLEEVLIAQAPIFEKLRNPVLRRTVAKVATIEKTAAMAGIPVSSLISALRKAAGHENLPDYDIQATSDGASLPAEPPEWVNPERVTETLDADKCLSRGENPLNKVLRLASDLAPAELIKITSSFPPLPLTDTLKQQGFQAITLATRAGKFETFVSSKKD